MAFGIKRYELREWQQKVLQGQTAFLTHYWYDERFPYYFSVTKVGNINIEKLINWGEQYNLQHKWIHKGKYPHFDLMGEIQYKILKKEGMYSQIERFQLHHTYENSKSRK